MKNKILVVSIALLALLLVSTSFTVAVSAKSSPDPQKIYPRGTICGDAQLGHWAPKQFNGKSDFQGFYSLFTINNMVLSGGNKGTVTSTSGTLAVYNHKGRNLLFYATYSGGMKGGYAIKGSSMYLTGFTASKIIVYFSHIKDHNNDHLVEAGTYHNAHVPNQVLSCTTQDALVSSTS